MKNQFNSVKMNGTNNIKRVEVNLDFFLNCTKWNVLNKAKECNKGSERSETQVNSVTVAVNVAAWG